MLALSFHWSLSFSSSLLRPKLGGSRRRSHLLGESPRSCIVQANADMHHHTLVVLFIPSSFCWPFSILVVILLLPVEAEIILMILRVHCRRSPCPCALTHGTQFGADVEQDLVLSAHEPGQCLGAHNGGSGTPGC